jgi:hypothetical protein
MSVESKFVVLNGVGFSEAIGISDSTEIRISYAVSVVGTVVYTVQHSLDGLIFFDNPDNQNKTVSADGNYVFPVRSVRVNVLSGTGTATLYVRQLVV